jgi:CRISPR-associated protein Csm1
MTNQDIYLNALAGLLHDIGKFMLRAGEYGTRIWDEEAKRDFKYKHAMLTASFADRYIPEQWRTEVKLAAGDHHNPQRREDLVVTLADYLSAAERNDGIEDDNVRKTHPKQLLSIFSAVKADGLRLSSHGRERAYLPLKPLALEKEVLFPDQAIPDADDVWKEYHNLWSEFITGVEQLQRVHESDGDLPTYLESLLLLMQRFTWAIPSAYYNNLPDISLYDHSRMTGALAAVLGDADFDEAALRGLIAKPESDERLALLVGGDISGVQDFIYTITNRGATSALRGRSFYLQLLTDALARFVLRRLELPSTNLIYAGGGNFYILARASDREKLTTIQQEISRAFLQHHQGDLYVALAGEALCGRDFFAGRLSKKWGGLIENLQQVKQRRFAELDPDELRRLFEPHGDGGNEDKQCQVCGAEHPNVVIKRRGVGDEGVRKCPSCQSYEDLGKDLRKARYLALEEIPIAATDSQKPPGTYTDVLACFGLKAQVKDDLQNIATMEGQRRVLLALQDDALIDLAPGMHTAIGRRFLVNATPILSEEEYYEFEHKIDDLPRHRPDGSWPDPVKPFSMLEQQSQGIKRLGVLRMDVDNMGKLFAEGLGDKAALSRIASLSFAASLYFEGWVEKLAEMQRASANGWSDRLYSIYSGGDDLFFVGSWDAVVEFARQVRADLTPYAAGHPGIHASAGIELVGGKYPLAQAAQDAGQAEGAAKSYQAWNPDAGKMETVKDAISFLGQVQPWRKFGLEETCEPGDDSIHQLMHLLVEMTDSNNGERKAAPKSLLRNLSLLYAQHAAAAEALQVAGADTNTGGQRQVLWGPWMWRGYYILKRSAHNEIKQLGERLHEHKFRNMDWIGLAARWAELFSR